MRAEVREVAWRGADAVYTRLRRDGCPPGPPWPEWLQLWRWIRRPVEVMSLCQARYGDAFTIRFPTRDVIVLVSDPEVIEAIFKSDPDELRAGEANRILEPILGPNSLITLDGPRHRRQRRLLTPPLHGESLYAYGEVMREVTADVMSRWPTGRSFGIHPELQRITLEVILRTVFGVEEGAQRTRLRDLLVALLDGIANPLLMLPWFQVTLGGLTPYARLARVKDEVDAALYGAIDERRAGSGAGRSDVLSLLVSARDEDGSQMTREELRDEMMTLLVAGHETTATALSWVCHRLVSHPDAAAAVVREVDSVAGQGLRPERVHELRELDAFVRETLRLNPIIPLVGRMLSRDTRLGGLSLPAGVIAAPCIHLTHRRPDLWAVPERFDPSRFLGKKPSPFAWLPFGGGIRRCIGMAFALYEMKVVLATVLTRYRLLPSPGHVTRMVRRAITFAPSHDMPVILRER